MEASTTLALGIVLGQSALTFNLIHLLYFIFSQSLVNLKQTSVHLRFVVVD